MQVLGPRKNGKYADCIGGTLPDVEKRSGSKSSGDSQNSGELWILKQETHTGVLAGIL